jgi:RNA polymerase sigma-70 factor, ECF subfamily
MNLLFLGARREFSFGTTSSGHGGLLVWGESARFFSDLGDPGQVGRSFFSSLYTTHCNQRLEYRICPAVRMADPKVLMERYCAGDASAFRELYAAVAPKLLGYLLRMARNRALADDLLQQTFLKVHRARSAFVLGADPVPWIYSIAHRTFLDEARRNKRAVVGLGTSDELPEISADLHGQSDHSRDEPRHDPEVAKAALSALSDLPDQQREAVVLTKLDGKSVAEAAMIAGTTVGAMKVRAHRGYSALRKALGRSE